MDDFYSYLVPDTHTHAGTGQSITAGHAGIHSPDLVNTITISVIWGNLSSINYALSVAWQSFSIKNSSMEDSNQEVSCCINLSQTSPHQPNAFSAYNLQARQESRPRHHPINNGHVSRNCRHATHKLAVGCFPDSVPWS